MKNDKYREIYYKFLYISLGVFLLSSVIIGIVSVALSLLSC